MQRAGSSTLWGVFNESHALFGQNLGEAIVGRDNDELVAKCCVVEVDLASEQDWLSAANPLPDDEAFAGMLTSS